MITDSKEKAKKKEKRNGSPQDHTSQAAGGLEADSSAAATPGPQDHPSTEISGTEVSTAASPGNCPAVEEEIKHLRAGLDETRRQAQANYDRFLRERAELENFKKRTQREKAEASKYAAELLIKDLLTVIDNLERAITHAEQESNGQPVVEGLTLVLKSFLDALERHGVKQIRPKGEVFDPAVHEAVAHLESDSEKPNSVIEEYQRGYILHDRLLRPAAVAVAKAPTPSEDNSGGGEVENPGSDG